MLSFQIEKFRLAGEVHLSDIKTNLESTKTVFETVLEENSKEDLVKKKQMLVTVLVY